MSCTGDAATRTARFDSVASATQCVHHEGPLVSEIIWGWTFSVAQMNALVTEWSV